MLNKKKSWKINENISVDVREENKNEKRVLRECQVFQMKHNKKKSQQQVEKYEKNCNIFRGFSSFSLSKVGMFFIKLRRHSHTKPSEYMRLIQEH